MPRYLDGIGSLTAVREVQVAPEVAGRVTAIEFTAGTSVEAGATLVQLNDAPERADLASYQASERLAIANLDRTRQLARRDFATQANVDQNQQALEEARAGIARSQAIIEQKRVRAPFGGELGLRQARTTTRLTHEATSGVDDGHARACRIVNTLIRAGAAWGSRRR